MALSSSGLDPTGSLPACVNLEFKGSCLTTLLMEALRRSMSDFGVPALTKTAYQLLVSTPLIPISLNVLTSGMALLRLSAASPIGFSLPLRM